MKASANTLVYIALGVVVWTAGISGVHAAENPSDWPPVSANRIRDLDRRGVQWQSFHDINFVNLNYQKFDAANWPVADSGLLGPVALTLVQAVVPVQ
jgi:hypothetical protein